MGLYQGDKPLSSIGKSPAAYAKDAGYTGTDDNFYTALANMPEHLSNQKNPHGTTASQVGADVAGAANEALNSAKAYTDQIVAGVIPGDGSKESPADSDSIFIYDNADSGKPKKTLISKLVELFNNTFYTKTEIDTTLQKKADLDENGKVPESQLPILGFNPQIVVTAPTGSTVTCTKDTIVLEVDEVEGTWTFDVPDYGTYIITATKGSSTATGEVSVEVVQKYTIALDYTHIYGVQWDGTSATTWSRTDDSAGFVNPTPYVAGASNYGSPFDNLYPWNGMVRVTDSTAGELVAIPKFWYKWTRSGNTMKLQIADKYVDGFSVSPAHMDRGDGSGERDVIYVGRYHCNSAYKSVTGNSPVVSITRATARSNIHNLGSTYWQFDYATLWTIQMLYLVEYGDWNTQKTIGYGCGNNSEAQAVGSSDSMPYHTGTMQSSRSTYAVGCQYRHIEDLWGNVLNWCDGIYFSGATIYGILNPANFSDTSNGTNIGTRPTSSGWISAYGAPTASGFEWALYPSAINGSESTYACDHCSYISSGVVLRCGGYYNRNQNHGLFCVIGGNTASSSYVGVGCRLLKLP